MNKGHSLNYIEFPADDLEAIKSFYAGAFGWEFTDYGPEYVAFVDGSGMDGGFTKGTIAHGSGPLVIVYSENLESSAEVVEKHGGTIIKPAYEFPGGKRFHFTDPAGNELAVWSEK